MPRASKMCVWWDKLATSAVAGQILIYAWAK